MRPTVAVTLGYDLPRNPGQLGVRGAILETLAMAGALHAAEPAHLRLFSTFLDDARDRARRRGVRRRPDERTLCTTSS